MSQQQAPQHGATEVTAKTGGMGLTRQQVTMVATLLFGAVLVVLNQTLLSPALPSIMASMEVTATTVQWLTSGYALVEAVIIPLNAYFMGRFRTRQLFIGGLVAFAAGTIVAALAPAFWVLLLGRMVQAAATGIIMPMVFTLILLVFPREKRGSAMGIVGLVIAFAPAIGPSLSGVLVDSVGWRALFVVVTCATLLVIIAAKVTLKDQGPFEAATFDKISVILLALGMTGFLYGLSSFASSPAPLVSLALMVVGAIILAFFVRRQLSLAAPLLKMTVLKSRRFRTIACIVPLLQALLVGSGVVYPIYIQSVLGYSATVSGLIMLPGAIIGALTGLAAGRIFDAKGVRGITLVGGVALVLAGLGMVGFELATPIAFVTGVNILMVMALQCLTSPLNTWGVNSLDNRLIPHGNALVNTLNQVGAAFGTALIVSLTAFSTVVAPEATGVEATCAGTHLSFMGICVILVIIFLAILVFVRNKPSDTVLSLADSATHSHDKGEAKEASSNSSASHNTSGQDATPAEDASKCSACEELAGSSVEVSEKLVADVMNTSPLTVHQNEPVRVALAMLAETASSGIVVLDDEEKAVGFVSDGDIMRYLADSSGHVVDAAINVYSVFDNQDLMERASTLLALPVSNIATRKLIYVKPTDRIEHACGVLAERRIKKVPVLEDDKLVGTLSRRDVVRSLNSLLNS